MQHIPNVQADGVQAEMDEEREFYAEEAGVLAELWVNDREAIHLAEVSLMMNSGVLADHCV